MMKRILLPGLIVLLIGGLALPALASAAPRRAGPVNISTDFRALNQGQAGIVRVVGPDVRDVRAVFQQRTYYFYLDGQTFIGILSADIDEDPGPYVMQVYASYADGTGERLDQEITVNSGGFGRSDILLPASLSPLLASDINDAEMAKLFNILDRFTPERYWEGGFVPPNNEPLVAWFGTYRLYNGAYWYRHTGVDVRVPVGTPVAAPASGRVMLAGPLPIRGNYVLIDHGWGIYSGLAHMSELYVIPGQWVRQGDILGLSGMTGRTSGAHIHWETAVGGAWTDPENLMALGLDASSQ